MAEIIETIILVVMFASVFISIFSYSRFQSISVKEYERYADLIQKCSDEIDKTTKCYKDIGPDEPVKLVKHNVYTMCADPPKKEERLYNCPNCGAPITGDKCEYCGTVFRDREEDVEILYADNRPVLTLKNDMSQLLDRISTEEMNDALIKAMYRKTFIV